MTNRERERERNRSINSELSCFCTLVFATSRARYEYDDEFVGLVGDVRVETFRVGSDILECAVHGGIFHHLK